MRSFGIGVLCISNKAAKVTGIDVVSPVGGMTITSWGVRLSHYQLAGREAFGEVDGPIPQSEGFASAPEATVTGHCPATDDGSPKEVMSEFAVTFRKPTSMSASTSALKVTYTIDGHATTTTVRYGVTLCDPSDTKQPCKDVNAA